MQARAGSREEELLDQKRGRNEARNGLFHVPRAVSEAQERLSAAARIEKEPQLQGSDWMCGEDLRGDLAQLRNDFEELQEREARSRWASVGRRRAPGTGAQHRSSHGGRDRLAVERGAT